MARREKKETARIIAPVRLKLRRAALLAVLSNLLWLVQAAAIAAGFSGLIAPPALLSPGASAMLFLAAAALRAGIGYAAEGVAFRAADRVIAGLRGRILSREAAEGRGVTGAGATAALAVEKLDLLAPWITRYSPARARVMIMPAVIFIAAVPVSWAVAVIFLITGPLIPVFMALVGMAAQAASEKQMREIGSLSELLVDRLGALLDMRLLGAGGALLSDFEAGAETLRGRSMAVLRIAFLSSTVLELFSAIGVAMVAVFLGFSLLGQISFGNWGTVPTVFEVLFLLVIAPEFYQPLRDLAAAWHDRAAAEAVAVELAQWEDARRTPALGSGADHAALPGRFGIVAKRVVLGRGDQRIAVPDFTLAPGESLAILGESGAGKTTLLAALAGLIRPESGDLRVAGEVLGEDNGDAWRARLGWMPQAPHFLDRSLRENVGFDEAAEITEALSLAHVLPVVEALPDGAETRLGETGAGLSGGEARRVMLARAIHARPDLVLADEPTADLDAETARIVTEALLRLVAGGTALIVATHDPALAARMDTRIDLGGVA